MWGILALALIASMAYMPESEARPSNSIYSRSGSYHDLRHHPYGADHDADASFNNHGPSQDRHGHHSYSSKFHDEPSFSGHRPSSQQNYGIVSRYGRY